MSKKSKFSALLLALGFVLQASVVVAQEAEPRRVGNDGGPSFGAAGIPLGFQGDEANDRDKGANQQDLNQIINDIRAKANSVNESTKEERAALKVVLIEAVRQAVSQAKNSEDAGKIVQAAATVAKSETVAITTAAARARPEYASSIAGAATKADSSQASAITKAAVTENKSQAAAIAGAVTKVDSSQASAITKAAATVVPKQAASIQAAVTKEAPPAQAQSIYNAAASVKGVKVVTLTPPNVNKTTKKSEVVAKTTKKSEVVAKTTKKSEVATNTNTYVAVTGGVASPN